MQQKLDSKTAYNLLIDGIIKEEKDFKKDQNKWILHSIYCGLAAERIAKALNLDSDYAKALGYIHDIGRRIDHSKHPIEGYKYLYNLGYTFAAKISITHSYIDNNITLAAGPFMNRESYNFIKEKLRESDCTIYDNIIQLCDLFCLETGFTTIEKRILDISLRKTVTNNSINHFKKTQELKKEIEEKLGCNLYSLFNISKIDLQNVKKHYQELLEMFRTIKQKSLVIGIDINTLINNFQEFINNKDEIDFNEETCFFIDKLTREGNLIELIINEDDNLSKEQLLFLKNILKKHDVYYSKIIRGTFLNDKSIDIAINGKDINWEEVYQNIVNIATNYKYSDKNDSKKYIKK